MQNKSAYFQNGQGKDNPNTPAPKKKKYKSDPALVNQPRFKEPLYRNYDVYETEGVKGPAKHGPGAGWHDMHKFKSIKDFLDSKRKKLKDKYKADDSWIQNDGSITKNRKVARRMEFLKILSKTAIDFQLDEYSDPTIGDYESNNPVGEANKGGGYLDKFLPEDDFEGKSPDKLDFGRDYADEDEYRNQDDPGEEELEELEKKYLSTEEPSLMGLTNGIEPKEDLDADYTVNNINPEYGTTDSGNQTYDNLTY